MDLPLPSLYEHTFQDITALKAVLASVGAERALLKVLPKNANDKNQIYIASDFGVLFDDFDLTLSERGESTSLTKRLSKPGKRIPQGVFNAFDWLRRDGTLVPARGIRAIIYTQFPEARISGLQAADGTMPASLSVAYTKEHGDVKRVLVLARLPLGRCVGIVCVGITPEFAAGIAALPGVPRAAACKRLQLDTSNRARLEAQLAGVLGRPLRGCRLDAYGQTLPFSGTQVCGYTLEHALGIIPNSNSDGDLYGIELKTHTQPKVTLFTPEPDGGLYAEDFTAFMKTYGYRDADGDYRVTGIHRANEQCGKSGLTLRIREQRPDADGEMQVFPYDRTAALTSRLDRIDVALVAANGAVAASWSLQRLMNCWGAKHNEVVYITATKAPNPDSAGVAAGYEHHVTFGQTVMWCRDTTTERLLQAIEDGVIYLDPAPKLHATDASKNKRRAQWRVNDITKAARSLYAVVEMKKVAGTPAQAQPLAA
jgi:hypothetical protein